MRQFVWWAAGGVALCCANAALAKETSKKPEVVVLATGGTIAGSGASSTVTVGYKAATVGIDALLRGLPELGKQATVRGEQVFQIASENITSTHWLTLARRVDEALLRREVDGVVVTHGSDTLEETAYFLNLVVHSRKPIVVVGAMRPPSALSADGPLNLYEAVGIAASRASMGRGVLIALSSNIGTARDTTKAHTSAVDAFRAPNTGFIGIVVAGVPHFYGSTSRKHTSDSEFDIRKITSLPRVDIVYGSADSSGVAVDAFVAAGAKGLVVAGTGNGSLSEAMKASLISARKQGVAIVRSSRTGAGIVARNGEVDDDAHDFVAADDLNPQKARLLLSLALTRSADPKTIQRMFWTY